MTMPKETLYTSGPGAECPENKICISLMRREDIPAVALIEKDNYALPWSAQAFCDALERENYLFLKAEMDGALAGYCGYLRSFEIAEITNVTVRKEYRRRGIGEKMLRALMKMGRADGIERFTLEVRRSNEHAIRLYQNLGFVQEGVRRGYYESPREDALILWTGVPETGQGDEKRKEEG